MNPAASGFNPHQYIENKINNDGWYITHNTLQTLNGDTVLVGRMGRVSVVSQVDRRNAGGCEAVKKAVHIASRIISRPNAGASGATGTGVAARGHSGSAGAGSVSGASSAAVSRGEVTTVYVPYKDKTPQQTSGILLDEIKRNVTGGRPCLIVYSAGNMGPSAIDSAHHNPHISAVQGQGAHAVMLQALSGLMNSCSGMWYQAYADKILAAPVSVRSDTTRYDVDKAINYLKQKKDEGYCILLIKNEDCSVEFPFCYGMKNRRISSDFDARIVQQVQRELKSLLNNNGPVAGVTSGSHRQGASGNSSLDTLGRDFRAGRAGSVGGDDLPVPSRRPRVRRLVRVPSSSSSSSASRSSSPASSSSSHATSSSLPIAQSLGIKPKPMFWNNPSKIKVFDDDHKHVNAVKTGEAQRILGDVIKHGWLRVVPESELKHTDEMDPFSQDPFKECLFGEVLAYQVKQGSDIRNYYIKAGDVVGSLSSLSELRDYSGLFYHMFRCPLTRQIVACSESADDKAVAGQDAIQFDDN
ncbi:hypothetical protein [Endozoicomonas elysicola]|uniref:Uncharacterized protein n=1 Tax=Endozoicomonas elysicola TaxID=305900 RepID=A0A081K9Q1_9GAMM|nr:hypothetical protein [Endozoicomonas elysicola]KEI70877.1 hypothetical protein GV64_09085 [Endozoicomonas elysicola]